MDINTTPEQAMHEFRVEIDGLIVSAKGHLNALPVGKREMALVHTKLQEAKMWTGKVLEELGSELPKEYQDKSN